MSPKRTGKKKTTRARRKSGGQTTAYVLSGAVPVAASVLPATLNPSPAPRTRETIVSPTTTAAKPRRPTRGATLAFEPECQLPFDAIKTDGLTIDQTCGPDGNAGDDRGK